jgi:hypothetical protein
LIICTLFSSLAFNLLSFFTFIFLFSTYQGSILPNDNLKLSFVFKSNESGIFTERWQLLTRPVLCGGRPIIFTLRGVTHEEDVHRQTRIDIEVCFFNIQTKISCQFLANASS